MICYQDEKMYGPPADGVSLDELNEGIKRLELEIYGRELPEVNSSEKNDPMIYDVDKGMLVKRSSLVQL